MSFTVEPLLQVTFVCPKVLKIEQFHSGTYISFVHVHALRRLGNFRLQTLNFCVKIFSTTEDPKYYILYVNKFNVKLTVKKILTSNIS